MLNVASSYQPLKMYLSFVGFDGSLIFNPFTTSFGAISVPPFETNVTVWVAGLSPIAFPKSTVT